MIEELDTVSLLRLSLASDNLGLPAAPLRPASTYRGQGAQPTPNCVSLTEVFMEGIPSAVAATACNIARTATQVIHQTMVGHLGLCLACLADSSHVVTQSVGFRCAETASIISRLEGVLSAVIRCFGGSTSVVTVSLPMDVISTCSSPRP